jgi:hypothetical protein
MVHQRKAVATSPEAGPVATTSSATATQPELPTKLLQDLPILSPASLIDHELVVEAVLVFLSALSLFAITAYPSISGGDAGELVVTACNGGVAHPPYGEILCPSLVSVVASGFQT